MFPAAVVLATALVASGALLVHLTGRWPRVRARLAGLLPSLRSAGRTGRGEQQDQLDPAGPDAFTVRVLRAQVRVLEEALAEALAEVAAVTAAEAARAAEVELRAPEPEEDPVAPITVVPDESDHVVRLSEVGPSPDSGVGAGSAGGVVAFDRVLPILVDSPDLPDLVLPVPPLPEPDARSARRWFRRHAA
jgi:hypothetical protein